MSEEVTGRSLICFSNIEWGIWKQRHHHLMERFARSNEVVFVETLGVRPPNPFSPRDLRRMGGRLGRAALGVLAARRNAGDAGSRPASLRVHSPLVVPYHGSGALRRLNAGLLLRDLRRLMEARGMTDPILWVYLPTDLILKIAERVPHRLLVYDCVDDITEFRHAPPDLAASERRLIRRADLIFATSRPLRDKCLELNRAVHYVPNAAEVDWFSRESRKASDPPDLAGVPHPRVGYIGAIREWFHVDLLGEAARRFPEVSFVLVGDMAPTLAPLRRLSNLHLLGPRPYSTLPTYLGALDVCLIPFRQTRLIRSTHPIKVYEYLAAGRPVVSTPMEEIAHLTEVDFAPAGEPFLQALGRRLARGPDPEAERRRRASVAGETWEARFQAVETTLAQALAVKPAAAAEA